MSARSTLGTGVVPVVVSDATALAAVGLTARAVSSGRSFASMPFHTRRLGAARSPGSIRVLDAIDRLSGTEPRPGGQVSLQDEDTVVEMAARPRARRGAR